MVLDPWDAVGTEEMTEYWRSVIPDISVSPAGDLSERESGLARVAEVRRRYALEIKHLGRTTRSGTGATTSITRISDWSALNTEERQNGRPGSPFALCFGIPSGRADADEAPLERRDFAILVQVGAGLLPKGALFLRDVPLVVHRHRRFRPLPGDANKRWRAEGRRIQPAVGRSRPVSTM